MYNNKHQYKNLIILLTTKSLNKINGSDNFSSDPFLLTQFSFKVQKYYKY